MNYSISVVIPVYNGEKYLKECISSVLSQSFNDFEVILVDDGSKDSSGVICDDYSMKYKNVYVYHKENEGINKTRYFGVKKAHGEWIAFLDQDDSLPTDALQELWDKHEETDLVIGYHEIPSHNVELDLEECQRTSITGRYFPPTPFAKLYRKSIMKDGIFDFPKEIDGAEDMIMNIRLIFSLDRAPRFVFKKVYNYRRNTASMSHTKKASLGYETLFHKVRSDSMPSWAREKFLKETISSRLNGLNGVAFNEPHALCNKENPFLVELREDIKRAKYKLSIKEKFILYLKWPFLYKLVSFCIMASISLKYRLGLNK